MPSALLPPLLAAIEPIAAYCARTPPPNKHADQCAALINAVSDYAEAVEAEDAARHALPDWPFIAARMIARLDLPATETPLMRRCRQHLAQPHLQARAAWPLARRQLAATVTSHHLGLPYELQ